MHESDTNDGRRTTQSEALGGREAKGPSLERGDHAAGSEDYKRPREAHEALMMRVLEAINRSGDSVRLVEDILHLVKQSTGLEAVGIRLREGEDYPYFVTSGFAPGFVEVERHLCSRDETGQIVRDAAGHPVLECMCGNVICGRFDPSQPYFTKRGSFWTNGTTQLLASTTEQDRQSPTRNRCNRAGYESVALIPLRAADEVIGLLQLNDHRPGAFTLEMIQFFEDLGASIGIALARQQAEAAMRESQERLALAASGTRIGLYERNSATGETLGTEQVARLLGLRTTTTTTTTTTTFSQYYHYHDWTERVHPEDLPRVEGELHRCLTERAPYEAEYRVVWPDGSVHWVADRGVFQYESDSRSPRMLGVVMDITDRKQAEERLHQSNYALLAAQKVAHVGSWTWHIAANRLEWSDEMFRIFGIEKEGFSGDLTDVIARAIHPDDRAAVERVNLSVIEEKTPINLEYRVVCPDGSVRVVWAEAGESTLDKDGKPSVLTGIVQDITERKRATEALQVYQQQLKLLASELSLAEERERRRIAVTLHDHTCQSLVLARIRIEEQLEAMSAGQAEAFRGVSSTLSDTIEGLRELTFDLSSPTLYRFGLEAALEELLEDKFGAEQGVEYGFSDDHEPKPLTEDVRVLLFRSVREILINILKHARAHKISLDIRRTAGSIRIAVTDDGIGFDVDEVSSLPARHRGFGLFSIKERLDCIGGVLEIDSRCGVGSRFILVAPLKIENRDSGRKHDVGQDSARG